MRHAVMNEGSVRGWSIALVLVCGVGLWSGAAVAEPVKTTIHRDRPMEADAHTTGLWRADQGNGQTLRGLVDGDRRMQLADGAEIIDAGVRLTGFERTVNFVNGGRMVADEGAAPIGEGPFTIELRLRFDRGGGKFVTAGDRPQLQWALLHRGSGYMDLWVPIRTGDGGMRMAHLQNMRFFKEIGGHEYRRFYHYALSFDGERTFRVFVDGRLAWTAALPEEAESLALEHPRLTLGRAARWKSDFHGEIAEARVSNVARDFEPIPRRIPQSLSEMGPAYRFDFGGADTPVMEHYLPISPDTPLYAPAQRYGWSVKPTDFHDVWFSPGRYTSVPEAALERHNETARRALKRDNITMPDGATFRADIPAGRYAVQVVLGHLRKNMVAEGVTVNSKRIGDHMRVQEGGGSSKPTLLRTDVNATTHQDTLTVRGLVDVDDDGLRVTVHGHDGEPVHVMGIEAEPWAAPVIQRADAGRRLVWTGPGAAPTGFEEAAAAFADRQFDKAVQLAEQIDDPLARATIWAWVLGYPNSTEESHVRLGERIMDTLRPYVHEHPDDHAARALMAATELFYPTLRIQIDDGTGVDGLFGSNPWGWMRDGAMRALQITEQEPYYGRARLLAGSLMYQQVEQGGGMSGPFEYRTPARHFATPFPTVYFRAAREAWPEATLARIYDGEKVPLEKEIEVPAGTPEWAALQHRALVRVMDIIHYWTDVRQDDQGLMGGGLGDDVETLRWWSVGHLVADDERTREGWRKLAETAWRSTGGVGYWHESRMSDVEHGAEPLGDTLSFLPFINYGTDRFQQTLDRQRVVLDNVLNVWTAKNPQGYRMFRSYYYSATEVSPRNADHFYNVRAANPAMFYTWFTRDPEATRFFVDWAESWRDAILAEGQGKPAGIWPVIVTFDKRRFTWDDSDRPWYDPGYYHFPAGTRVYNVLLAAYELTGEERYLDPQREVLELMRKVGMTEEGFDAGAEGGSRLTSRFRAPLAKNVETEYEKGSLAWALWTGHAGVGKVGARYRLVTGDRSYDDVLIRYAPPVTQARIAFEQARTSEARRAALAPIKQHLEAVLSRLDYNWPLRTTEPKSTDRVWVGGTEALIAMGTGTATRGGARGSERHWPLFGVSWKNTGTDVAMFMTHNTTAHLAGALYSFADDTREIGAQLWRLEPGEYRLTLTAVAHFGEMDGEPLVQRDVIVEQRGQVVPFELPAGQEVWFEIERRE